MNKLLLMLSFALLAVESLAEPLRNGMAPVFQIRPIGWVRKAAGRTTIEVDEQYKPALLGVDELDAI